MRANPGMAWQSAKAGLWSAFFVFLLVLAGVATAQGVGERPYVKVEKIFGKPVAYDRKLAEVEGLAPDLTGPAGMVCLIAAVRLKPDAAQTPPRRDMSRPSFLQFGGAWKATPRRASGPSGCDLLQVCGAYLRQDGLDDALLNALEAPGSYYLSDWTGSVLQLYAPQRRLAVSIRYLRRNAGG